MLMGLCFFYICLFDIDGYCKELILYLDFILFDVGDLGLWLRLEIYIEEFI